MKKTILLMLIVFCAVIFGVSAFRLITYFYADHEAEQGFANLLPAELADADAMELANTESEYDKLLPHYEELHSQNEDFVGWLRIPGTRVSYPVMQTKWSPEYYIDRNFEEKYSASGTLFADAINNVELPSDVVTIYGHRMKTGAMFGSLGDFLDSEFLLEHDTIIFDTFSGRYEYKVYLAFSIDVSKPDSFQYHRYSMFKDPEEFNKYFEQLSKFKHIENPVYKPSFGDKFILLSTCEYTYDDGRLVVVGVKVD